MGDVAARPFVRPDAATPGSARSAALSPDGEAGPAATVPAAEAFVIAPVPSAGRTDMAAAVDNATPCARTRAAGSGLAIATIATIATVLIATGGAVAGFSRPTR